MLIVQPYVHSVCACGSVSLVPYDAHTFSPLAITVVQQRQSSTARAARDVAFIIMAGWCGKLLVVVEESLACGGCMRAGQQQPEPGFNVYIHTRCTYRACCKTHIAGT